MYGSDGLGGDSGVPGSGSGVTGGGSGGPGGLIRCFSRGSGTFIQSSFRSQTSNGSF